MTKIEKALFSQIKEGIDRDLNIIHAYLDGKTEDPIQSWRDLELDSSYRVLFGHPQLTDDIKC